MKILYIGTVSENNEYEKIMKQSRVKASVAPHTFETAFLKGFLQNGVSGRDLEILSFPMIASFPGSRLLYWGSKKQKILNEYDASWIPAVNVQGLKMLSQSVSSKRLIKKWLKKNSHVKDKCIVIYSIYKPIAQNIVKLCKKYDCRCFAFVPDLPKHMYLGKSGLSAILADSYVKKAVAIQDKFDGYIYLTEAMIKEIAEHKPALVVEGIADDNLAEADTVEKSEKIIMYAGAISKRYGFENLVRAFTMLDGDYELHIYGYGDFLSELEAYSLKDTRIKYMGRRPRAEILQKEREAALLVNVRNPDDEFTKYSFPSKTMEYMLSGTPLLTTRLPGIPEEYFDHCLSIKDNEVESIRCALEKFFALKNNEREQLGNSAKEFILYQKNQTVQAEKVLTFLHKCIAD